MTSEPQVLSETHLDNSFLGETIQVCVVTRDYRRTMQGLVNTGIGPWRVYTFDSDTNLTETQIGGVPQPLAMKLCLAFSGSMMWEIVQPLKGPTIYEDFLKRHDEGIHHVAFDCNGVPWAERLAAFEARGFPCIQSGVWMGRVPWAYFGTEDATGTVFETFHIPDDFVLPDPEEWFPAPPFSA